MRQRQAFYQCGHALLAKITAASAHRTLSGLNFSNARAVMQKRKFRCCPGTTQIYELGHEGALSRPTSQRDVCGQYRGNEDTLIWQQFPPRG